MIPNFISQPADFTEFTLIHIAETFSPIRTTSFNSFSFLFTQVFLSRLNHFHSISFSYYRDRDIIYTFKHIYIHTTHVTTFLPYVPRTTHCNPFFFFHRLTFLPQHPPHSHPWNPPSHSLFSFSLEKITNEKNCVHRHRHKLTKDSLRFLNNNSRALQARNNCEFCNAFGRWQHQNKMCKTTVVHGAKARSIPNVLSVVSSTR